MNAGVIIARQSNRIHCCKGLIAQVIKGSLSESIENRSRSILPCRSIHGGGRSQMSVLQHVTNKRSWGCRNSKAYTTIASEKVKTENRKIIVKLLGIDDNEASRMRIPFKLINEEKAVHTLEVLKKFGFFTSSVHLYPELLLMSGGAVENYIRIMQETGFSDVREVFIVRFRTVYKQSLSVLQQKSIIPKINNILERYCTELEEDDAFLNDCVLKLPKDTDKITLFDLRNVIMGRYLGKLLLGSLDETLDSFVKYPRMYYRCFNWVKRNCNILREFGFSNEKIRSHFYLLHGDPVNLSRITKIQSLAGLDINKILTLRPKIMMSSYDTLIDIEKSLIEHGISFKSVQKYPEVYTLSAATIRQRLQEMDTVPEFKLLKTHPRVARLLYYQKKAKSRLDEFREMQVRVPSLHLLSSDTKRYNRSLATDFRIKGVDIIIYLSDVFQVDRQRVRDSLVRHPHWLHIPLVNITSVLKFVQSVGSFNIDQLVDAIPVMLYPKEKVEKEVENVLKLGVAKINDSYFLQMVLYYLEQPSHFTGDAVWLDKEMHQEFDEEEGDGRKSSEVSK